VRTGLLASRFGVVGIAAISPSPLPSANARGHAQTHAAARTTRTLLAANTLDISARHFFPPGPCSITCYSARPCACPAMRARRADPAPRRKSAGGGRSWPPRDVFYARASVSAGIRRAPWNPRVQAREDGPKRSLEGHQMLGGRGLSGGGAVVAILLGFTTFLTAIAAAGQAAGGRASVSSPFIGRDSQNRLWANTQYYQMVEGPDQALNFKDKEGTWRIQSLGRSTLRYSSDADRRVRRCRSDRRLLRIHRAPGRRRFLARRGCGYERMRLPLELPFRLEVLLPQSGRSPAARRPSSWLALSVSRCRGVLTLAEGL